MRNYKKSSKAGFKLEEFVANNLKIIDKYSRPTRGSGSGNEIGDVSNKYFYIDCKEKHTSSNIILKYKEEWLHLYNKLPLSNNKPLIFIVENKEREQFVILNFNDFLRIIEKGVK